MKPARRHGKRPGATLAPVGNVLGHLADSLRQQNRRYQKRLKKCRRHFSEDAVHEARIEARRLLATLQLLGPFVSERKLEKARHLLKEHLDTFDPLRDTHVQLVYVGRMTRVFSAARPFREWLLKREARFTRATRKALKRLKTHRLARRIAALEAQIRDRRKQTSRKQASLAALRAMNRAFARVMRLARRVSAEDPDTIHRTRIAFKRFRYMAEALAPLLPAAAIPPPVALRGYQSMMGVIQDAEVLLRTLERFLRRKEVEPAAATKLRNELLRRRAWLIQVYIQAAGQLRQFRPSSLIRA